MAQEDETRVITDAVGDGGALPDCEPAGGANSAVDIIQVEVSDVAGTRTVLIRTDGDLGAAIAAEPDVRVEVWVTGDGGVTLIRFRHGVQAGEPLDDVIDEEGLPVGEVPASIEAGPRVRSSSSSRSNASRLLHSREIKHTSGRSWWVVPTATSWACVALAA